MSDAARGRRRGRGRSPSRPADRHGRDRRLPERRQVDADQPADRDARRGRPRDERHDARPQGARLRVDRQALPARSTPAASTSPRKRRDHALDRRAGARGDRRGRPRAVRRRRARRASTPGDEELATILRDSHTPVLVLANKIDDPAQESLALEFHRLGLGDPFPLSGMHGHDTGDLLDEVVERLEESGEPARRRVGDEAIRVAILGRPNVGKSSLFNALLGAERTIVSEVPGTTRDSIDTVLERDGRALPADRHGRPAPQAQAAAGDRVLLGAARARGRRARRRRARPDRRGRGDRRGRPRRRRRGPEGAVLDARRALEVGHFAGDDRGCPARSSSAGCASARRSSPPRRRPAAGSRACSTRSPSSTTSTRAASRRRELNRFLGELKRGAPAAVDAAASAEPALRRAGHDAAAALPLHRQRHEPRHARLRLLGRERAARAVRARGRAGGDRLPAALVKASSSSAAGPGAPASRACSPTAATRSRSRPHQRRGRARDPRDRPQPALPDATSTSTASTRRRSTRRRSPSAELVVVAVPSRAFRSVVEALAGRRAGAQPDEGPRPGDRRAALDARPRPARRRAVGPEHGRGGRRRACRARP